MDLAQRARATLIVSLFALGCYNPNIAQGGFKCGPGGACPENFHCTGGRCYRGDAGPDTATKPTCMSVTPDASTCSRPAAAGEACSLACQAGCDCGWCAVVNGAATCLTGTPGTKKVGDPCDPSKSADCLPGLFCRAESCGARCYKLCDTSDDCPTAGTSCNITETQTGIKLCSLPDPGCNPLTLTGCPDKFACYVTGSATYCDCPGTTVGGATCNAVNSECVPGYGCAGARGNTTCTKVCSATVDCNGSGTCTLFGTYGYCL
jgi:hypothetical protein